jgi:hypothetical protein
MPHPLASLIDRLERARKAIFRRQLPYHRIAPNRVAPYMGKPGEVEGRRQRRFFGLTVGSPGPTRAALSYHCTSEVFFAPAKFFSEASTTLPSFTGKKLPGSVSVCR